MYELLGITLVLAALLTINALATMAAAGCWRAMGRSTGRMSSATRAEILFALRIGPPVIAVISVAAFLLPSYLLYEPVASGEVVSKKLGALALISIVGVTLAVWRGMRSWMATRSLLREWLNTASPVQLSGIGIPTFRIPHTFPIIAVVGTLRPRLFIADRVLQSLSEEELIAAIAHECGHLAARDNLKRVLLRASRDMLTIVPCGRSIDRAWSENAEAAADEHAADRGSNVALNLASALIEIARMVPVGARPTMPIGSFLLGDETAGVKGRVSRLIALATNGRAHNSRISGFAFCLARLGWLTIPAAILMILLESRSLASLHNLMEHAVRALS